MEEVKEGWQLLIAALEVAPSQEVKDAIAAAIDTRIKELDLEDGRVAQEGRLRGMLGMH
jgi:hypothetical protein